MNRITTTFSVLAIATTASLATSLSQPVQAAIITYDFNVDVISGPEIGKQFAGFFSYDDTLPTPGYENTLLPYYDVTDFGFNFAGKTYTRSNLYFDGRQGPGALPLTIIGGTLSTDSSGRLSLIPQGGTLSNFGFSTFSPFAIGRDWFTLTSNRFNYAQFPTPGSYVDATGGEGLVSFGQRTAATPEPSTTLGLIGSLGLGWWLKKKRQRKNCTL